MFVNPRDAIVVEETQIARHIIVDEQLDDLSLVVVLSHRLGLLEPIDDVSDGMGIASGGRPHLLEDLSIPFNQGGIKTIGDRLGILPGSSLQSRIIVLCLLLGDSLIEMTSRGLYQILAIRLVDTLRQDSRIENNGEEFATEIL